MHSAAPLPAGGEVFLDPRGGGRALRISWHDEAGVVVLSLWRAGICTGTFRLPAEDVPGFVDVLRRGLHQAYDAAHHAGNRTDDLVHERTGAVARDRLPLAGEI